MAIKTEKLINRSAINVDHTTNVTGLLSAIGAVTSAVDGISHGRAVGEWLPMVFVGGGAAIAQYLQGEPTPKTRLIASVLQLEESRTNAELLRAVFRRIIASGVVPGIESDAVGGDRVDADLPVDYRDGGVLETMPEWSDGGVSPRLNVRAQAWRAADIALGRKPIEGTDIYPSQYSAMSQPGGDFDDVTQG